jgi:hypothetical protein
MVDGELARQIEVREVEIPGKGRCEVTDALLIWTDCPYPPSGTGTVPRQQEGRRRTDC